MKGVTGGMKWTIISIVIGIIAVALLWLFLTGAGKAMIAIFPGLIDAAMSMVSTIIGRIPLIGPFLK